MGAAWGLLIVVTMAIVAVVVTNRVEHECLKLGEKIDDLARRLGAGGDTG